MEPFGGQGTTRPPGAQNEASEAHSDHIWGQAGQMVKTRPLMWIPVISGAKENQIHFAVKGQSRTHCALDGKSQTHLALNGESHAHFHGVG